MGKRSDRLRLRGPLVIAAVGLFWLFWIACSSLMPHVNPHSPRFTHPALNLQFNKNPSPAANGQNTLS